VKVGGLDPLSTVPGLRLDLDEQFEGNYVAEAPWTFLNSIIDTAIPTRECDPLSPGSDREISPRPYAPEPPLSLVLRGEILQVHNLVNRTPLR